MIDYLIPNTKTPRKWSNTDSNAQSTHYPSLTYHQKGLKRAGDTSTATTCLLTQRLRGYISWLVEKGKAILPTLPGIWREEANSVIAPGTQYEKKLTPLLVPKPAKSILNNQNPKREPIGLKGWSLLAKNKKDGLKWK